MKFLKEPAGCPKIKKKRSSYGSGPAVQATGEAWGGPIGSPPAPGGVRSGVGSCMLWKRLPLRASLPMASPSTGAPRYPPKPCGACTGTDPWSADHRHEANCSGGDSDPDDEAALRCPRTARAIFKILPATGPDLIFASVFRWTQVHASPERCPHCKSAAVPAAARSR